MIDKLGIIEEHKDNLEWYVLKYDMVTTEYNNEIVFKTYEEAKKEYEATEPTYNNERVELMYAPLNMDEDNVLMESKTL